VIINHKGEIVNFYITSGNIADNNTEVVDTITNAITGKLIADRGYIGKFDLLYKKGITLIHGIRKGMKNKLVLLYDKLLLKKRGIIETVFGILKEGLSLEHARHRSDIGAIMHIFTSIAAYAFKTSKPAIFKGDIPVIA